MVTTHHPFSVYLCVHVYNSVGAYGCACAGGGPRLMLVVFLGSLHLTAAESQLSWEFTNLASLLASLLWALFVSDFQGLKL